MRFHAFEWVHHTIISVLISSTGCAADQRSDSHAHARQTVRAWRGTCKSDVLNYRRRMGRPAQHAAEAHGEDRRWRYLYFLQLVPQGPTRMRNDLRAPGVASAECGHGGISAGTSTPDDSGKRNRHSRLKVQQCRTAGPATQRSTRLDMDVPPMTEPVPFTPRKFRRSLTDQAPAHGLDARRDIPPLELAHGSKRHLRLLHDLGRDMSTRRQSLSMTNH